MEWECDNLVKSNFFHLEPKEYRERKFKAFKQAFDFHYKNCPEFNRYCKMQGISEKDIKDYGDLGKIPPIPSDAFRESEKLILSVPEKEVKMVLTTSGTTSKKPVKFPLDAVTLGRMNLFNARLWQEGHEFDPQNLGSVYFLAPKPSESDTGLVKGGWLAFKTMGFKEEDIKFAVENGEINVEKFLENISIMKKPRHLYGPPFAYIFIAQYIEKNNKKIKLEEGSRLLVTGGWKGVTGEISKQELCEQISRVFGIKQENIRDGYGSTDIMTMLPECSFHKKHIPPWVNVSCRNPEKLDEEVKEGKVGILVLMSSKIQSYPAFVMPADMGIVKEGKCQCGRYGQTVEIVGRAKKTGLRGCAIRLQEFMTTITK